MQHAPCLRPIAQIVTNFVLNHLQTKLSTNHSCQSN